MKANSSGTHLDRDWMIRGAMKDEGVGAAPFERPAPRSLAACLADTAGQWALRRHGEARQPSVGLPGNHTGGEDERTPRVERIETRRAPRSTCRIRPWYPNLIAESALTSYPLRDT